MTCGEPRAKTRRSRSSFPSTGVMLASLAGGGPGAASTTPSGASANSFPAYCRRALENRARGNTLRDQTATDVRQASPANRPANRMTVLYLASLIIGLVLAVRIMTHGVERPREDHPTGDRSFR